MRRSCSASPTRGRTETIRYLQQVYPYYGFYAQDDWRINDKLVLNYGLRYEFTQPPRAGGDQYSDFSPTKPNPAVNNYPGALVFAGDGPGREGTSSLFPGYYGAVAPRVSFAYSANDKTIVPRRRGPIVRTRDGGRRAAVTSPGSSVSTCSRRPMPASRRRSIWIRACRPIRCRR